MSSDLIHWKDLPYAIYPSPERACFSGSAWVEEDRVLAMYYGTEYGNIVAESSDPLLLNWEKISIDKPAVAQYDEQGKLNPYTVFDPFLWKEGDYYYSLSAGRKAYETTGRPLPVGYLFRSKDLKEWEYMHEFIEGDRFSHIGDDLACPYFFPVGNRHIMLHYSHMRGGQYLLGDYDTERQKFVVTEGGKFNFGASSPGGMHAPSAAPDGNGGVITIFNMNPAAPTKGWNQIMSLPRRITLISENEIGQEPVGDIESLRGEHVSVEAQEIPANKEVVFENIKGDAMEISMEIDAEDASSLEICLLRSNGKEEYTSVKFYPHRGVWAGRNYYLGVGETSAKPLHKVRQIKEYESLISLDNTYSSLWSEVKSRPAEVGSFKMVKGETLKLRIFIDKSVVEVFANGRQCVGARVYPTLDESVGFSIRSQGKPSKLISLDAWQMKSIY